MSQPMMENSAEPYINDARIVIHVDELKKRYRRGKVEAVKGVSFDVHRGHIFGLIGPDGAGKTSIMQILAGVLRANAGVASIDNIDGGLKCPERPERQARSRSRRRKS